jgi:hypothetical protein
MFVCILQAMTFSVRARQSVQVGLTAAAQAVVAELQSRFPKRELLDALSIVHPRFFQNGTFSDFEERLGVLCDFYGVHKVNAHGGRLPALIDSERLKNNAPFFFAHAQPIARLVLGDNEVEQLGAGIV